MMKIFKKNLWIFFGFMLIGQVYALVPAFVYPVGGGEYHLIFAYSDGGRFDVALQVFAENLITGCVLTILFVFFRFPLHWAIISTITFSISWLRWRSICYFPHQSIDFHQSCIPLLYIIAPVIFSCGYASHWLAEKFFKKTQKTNRMYKGNFL